MSWNLPNTFNTNSNDSQNQSISDRFALMFDLIADMRRRLETSEQTVSQLTTRIELLENTNNTNNLFSFETQRPLRNRREPTNFTYEWTSPIISNNNNNNLTNATGRSRRLGTPATAAVSANIVANDTLTPLVDNIFNDIILDSVRRGLSVEHLNANTSTELYISQESNNQGTEGTEGAEGADGEEDSCSICREPFENSSIIRKINSCGHKFHLSCIDTWFQTQHTCPMCRVSVRIVIPTGNTSAAETDRENNRSTYAV